ncbi:hypothetical protein ACJJTC_008051 [Scirpophaga incertulas]
MCLWILTACLGLIPANPPNNNVIVVQGVPTPIIQPTTISTVSPTFLPTTGSLAIDPRLGSTPAPQSQSPPSAALQIPPITGYSGQIETFEVPVKFPREKRSTDSEKIHSIVKRQSCVCVTAGTCATNTNNINHGAGQIDVRIVGGGTGGIGGQCLPGQEYCCSGTTAQIACGTLQATPPLAVAPIAGQANFGEYPWQAMILSRQNEYLAGGVLVDQQHVLTVTHRLTTYIVAGTAPNIKVRLGEWDAAVITEPVPYQEYNVQRVFSHPSFNPSTLQYDITILRLATPVPFTPTLGAATTINRACLPPSAASTYVGQRCWVSGWGKNLFGSQGQYQQILKKVDVPIVPSATCQSQMQAARLGPSFVLDTTSFICAGGEANKDSCTGDGGSGLVCSVNGQWVVVGLVAWGLGCANTNVPAAYVNVAALLPWIQQQIATV